VGHILQQLHADALTNSSTATNASLSSVTATVTTATASTVSGAATVVKRDATYICFLLELLGTISSGVTSISMQSTSSSSSSSSSSSLLSSQVQRNNSLDLIHQQQHDHLSMLSESAKNQLLTQLTAMKSHWISFLTTKSSSSSSSSSRDSSCFNMDSSGIYVLAVLQQIDRRARDVIYEHTQHLPGMTVTTLYRCYYHYYYNYYYD